MGSAKLLTTLLATLLSFPRIQAGLCVPQHPESSSITTSSATEEISTASIDFTTSTPTTIGETTATLLEGTTTGATIAITSNISSDEPETTTPVLTTTTPQAPALCTLSPTGPEELIQAPSEFSLVFETCDGSYGESYRMAGSGSNGEWIWSAYGGPPDKLSLDAQGHVFFDDGLLIAAQPAELDHEWVSWIYPNDQTKADWPRLECHAVAVDNGSTKYLRCTGIGPTYVHFQICNSDPTILPQIYLAPEVKPECKEVNLVIIEIAVG